MKSKLIAFVMGLLIATNVIAGDNSIYIQQAGDNTSVQMVQDGAGNVVQGLPGAGSGTTNPAIINGNNNTVTVDQVGTGDTLSFGIQTTIANGVTGGNAFSYTVTGNNGSAVIDSNADGLHTSASNTLTVAQTGNYSKLNANILGSTNTLGITTTDLQAARQAGKSLATLAGDKKDALINALVNYDTTQIDAAVTAGTLTASQATNLKANLKNHVTKEVESVRGGHKKKA